ncbi:SGNH hydrolase [Marasmius fiardii PR-910]|nr:SGNH hydrolase [Marasmius fiardii PR-910]
MLAVAVVVLATAFSSVLVQTVYLTGDSIMAKNEQGLVLAATASSSLGWGQYLGQYSSIPVLSSRSYTEQGRFNTIANTIRSGDFCQTNSIVIGFGHNDGSSGSVDNGRQVATERRQPYEIQGSHPCCVLGTPSNDWFNGEIVAGPRFVGYAQTAASRTGATYIDHYDYTAQAHNKLGQSAVAPFFPVDHTHTSPAGANVAAKAFVRGIFFSSSALKSKVKW